LAIRKRLIFQTVLSDLEISVIRTTRPLSAVALVLAMAAGPALGQGAPAAPPSPAPVAPAPAPVPAPVDVGAIALRPEQVVLLRQALDQAPAQGFGDRAFTPPELDGLLASPDPVIRRRGEALLKTAVLRYAAAVHRGRLAANQFEDEWGLRPAAFDPAPGFQAAVAANALPAWLASLPPAYAGYQQLVKGLAVYRAIAAHGGWKALPDGAVVKPGGSDPRVPALRERLAAEDPAAAAGAGAGDSLDPATDEALKAFQRRHGMDGDGKLDKATLAALNAPVGQRILQIMANMERWRWLPATLPAERAQVNIAAATMTLFQDDKPVLSMKAAAGRPDDRTPMLMSQIRAIVLNPPWNIPASIARKEIYPKERAHPGYMQREDIHVVRTASGGERLQQRAGPKSSLGQVKFDFDNPYGVYLHDTPARSAFGRANRMVSHGCVRLEKPRDLAAALLQGEGSWDPQSIDAAISQGGTRWVTVHRPVAVLIFYWTAFVGPDGAMNFSNDPYDWDHVLLQKISDQKYSNA
jgi:murein L,D-transpeptidase YcbB/YkuD